MKYGINQNENLIKCANCNEVVSNNGEFTVNFCSKCGAPLSVSAIADFEERKDAVKINLLNELKEIAADNKTDSFLDIVKVYREENE